MEITDAILFVQGFVWASLLLRQSSARSTWLGFAFFTIFIIYFLRYLNTVFNAQIPIQIIQIGSILAILLLSCYLVKNAVGQLSNMFLLLYAIVVFLAILFLVYSLSLSGKNIFWKSFTLFAAGDIIFNWYIFIFQCKRKTFAGSIMGDPQLRVDFSILLNKSFAVLFGVAILIITITKINTTLIYNGFQSLLGILAFISGYVAVTSKFIKEYPKQIAKQQKENSVLASDIMKLMQEKKLYLDCELTLGKMADILKTNENEISQVLHGEMGTSFYKLINDYRIETVKQKLKEFDSRNYTIMASAYESGFNSKSTFYRIFKEYTNMTPKEYIEIIND